MTLLVLGVVFVGLAVLLWRPRVPDAAARVLRPNTFRAQPMDA